MVSVSFTIADELKAKMEAFAFINWSEVAREEGMRKLIFEEFIRTGTLSPESKEFCGRRDWHPVDELPLKDAFVKELAQSRKSPGKSMTAEEFRRFCRSV